MSNTTTLTTIVADNGTTLRGRFSVHTDAYASGVRRGDVVTNPFLGGMFVVTGVEPFEQVLPSTHGTILTGHYLNDPPATDDVNHITFFHGETTTHYMRVR